MSRHPVVKIAIAYGRLYVTGPDKHLVKMLPGCTHNYKRDWYEISLTIPTLNRIRVALGVDKATFKAMCGDSVLRWVEAANASNAMVRDIHAQLETGWRRELPWDDAQNEFTPMAHQEIMASVATTLDGTAFTGQMGTSKTRPAIESMRYMMEQRGLDIVVVVCPKGVVPTWRKQLARWAPTVPFKLLVDMPMAKRRTAFRNVPKGTVVVMNYDIIAKMTPVILERFEKESGGFAMDEAHRIRNPQAKWSKACMKLAAHADWRLTLTGTPVLGGAENVWSQWYVIDFGVAFGANYVQFKQEFFEPSFDGFKLLPRQGTLEEIGNRMRKRGLRYLKSECMDLPPKIFEEEEVELGTEQKRIYEEMREELVARIRAAEAGDEEEEGLATAATQLVAILRLAQITSGHVPDIEGRIVQLSPNPKLDALERIVRENIDDQQIIVWCCYRPNYTAITERLADLKPELLVGGMTVEERSDIEDRFRDGTTRLVVANQQVGGSGLDLWAASLAIYYSQDYNPESRQQSEDRCHRKGSEIHDKVTYVDLMAKGTIDHVIMGSQAAKKGVAEAVVDLKEAIGV
jgi:SNF2 family DNA or RNA helicase